MARIFKIIPDGASYNTVYSDLEFKCQVCDLIVDKVYYLERTGIAEWICKDKHLSRDTIGV